MAKNADEIVVERNDELRKYKDSSYKYENERDEYKAEFE
jgi:hypothetical protein